ncbi:glycosyltransferase family 39 protein, partial [Alphaproteobacteria bacterium]|nr:glycosyltransferase family 39 protein [Alphaproteobacteria bacterium]
MYNLKLKNKKNIFFCTFIAFLLSHFFNIYYFGIEFGGDWWAYSTVAKNILSGCGVSISEIESGECIPHFGGNQGPGYPLFIAICWYLFDNSNLSVIIIQNLILFLSYIYIILTINNYIKSKKILIFLIFTLNFSPMYFAWSRHLLTETLSISLTIIIFSILIKSFFKKKIDIYKLAITFICLTFIRLDGILLLIPIIFSFITIYKFQNIKVLTRKILIFLIIFSIPWGIWGFRNYMVNLPMFMPSIYTLPGNNNTPTGFIKWVSTWSTSQYEVSSTLFPVYKKLYSEISIPNNILEKINEKNEINILLKELKLFDGNNFPNDIDSQFLEIANNKIKNELQNY